MTISRTTAVVTKLEVMIPKADLEKIIQGYMPQGELFALDKISLKEDGGLLAIGKNPITADNQASINTINLDKTGEVVSEEPDDIDPGDDDEERPVKKAIRHV